MLINSLQMYEFVFNGPHKNTHKNLTKLDKERNSLNFSRKRMLNAIRFFYLTKFDIKQKKNPFQYMTDF